MIKYQTKRFKYGTMIGMENATMIDLNDYFYFVKVVESQGFSSAARVLNTSKSKISRHISKLEERIERRLIQRNSRHFMITDAGHQFYLEAKKVIEAMEVAENSLSTASDVVKGSVSLSSSLGMANFLLKELLIDFMVLHPDVTIKQHVTNEYIDLIPNGIDLVVRGHQDNLPDSNYIQRKMATVKWHLFGSPSFLSNLNKTISSPTDLIGIKALGLGWQNDKRKWKFIHKEQPSTEIAYQPCISSDDMSTLKYAAKKDQGVVVLPSYVCREEVQQGSLIRLLPDWQLQEGQLSILLPSRKGTSSATKALTNYLCELTQTYIGAC